MKNSGSLVLLLACLGVLISASSCLKTRAQLRDDERDGPTKPVSIRVQEVKSENQYVIDEIRGELTRMTGRMEEVERSQKQADRTATSAQKEEYKKLEARVLELENAQKEMIERIQKVQDTAEANPDDLFERARAQYDSKNYEAATRSLSAYLKSPKAKFSETATFMRAESYFAMKDYKNAIIDYSKFPEKFTRSKHVATALLKIGQSFEGLGMKQDAKPFYQELVEKFPKSPEAKKVRSKVK